MNELELTKYIYTREGERNRDYGYGRDYRTKWNEKVEH